MRQKLTIIHQDENGNRNRVVITQPDEFSDMQMEVQGLAPDEVMRLMMLLRNLSEHIMVETANKARNERTVN